MYKHKWELDESLHWSNKNKISAQLFQVPRKRHTSYAIKKSQFNIEARRSEINSIQEIHNDLRKNTEEMWFVYSKTLFGTIFLKLQKILEVIWLYVLSKY